MKNKKTTKQKLIRSIQTDIFNLDNHSSELEGLLNFALKFVPNKELFRINDNYKKQLTKQTLEYKNLTK